MAFGPKCIIVFKESRVKVMQAIVRCVCSKWLIGGLCLSMGSHSILSAHVPEEEDSSHFAIRGDYLYFQPSLDNDFIAVPNGDVTIPFRLQPAGPGKKNKFDYASAFRLSAFYRHPTDCYLIQKGSLSFTYLPAHHERKIGLADFLNAVIPSSQRDSQEWSSSAIPGFLTSAHHLDYGAVDVRVNLPLFNHSRFKCMLESGLHGAWIGYKHHVQAYGREASFSKPSRLKERSDTWGIGPQVGLSVSYHLSKRRVVHSFYEGLNLIGSVRGGLLLSRARAHFEMASIAAVESSVYSSSFHNPKTLWKVFPFWAMTIGLSFSLSIKGYAIEVEMGYEYLTYPNFINRIQFPSNGSTHKADNLLTNLDFQGPYMSLSLHF